MTDVQAAKSLVQAQFGANAAQYATSTVHAKGASLGRLVELVGPRRDWRMLDVATGAGHTALAFAPLVQSVIASDLTREMLVLTAKLAADRQLTNIATIEADAEFLPFVADFFDLVTCRIAPHHFPDIAAFVGEVQRVLKPGGTFALVDNIAPDMETTPGFPKGALEDADKNYNMFEKVRDPSHGRALTAHEWRAVVIEAGLTIQHVEHTEKAIDFEAWCRTMSVPSDTIPILEKRLDTASPALRAFLQPKFLEGKREFSLTELILIAVKMSEN